MSCVFGDTCPYPHKHPERHTPEIQDEIVFRAAANKLSDLHEACKHIPLPLTHSEERRGLIWAAPTATGMNSSDDRAAAQTFYGGLADLVVALGPDVLAPLAVVMEDAALSAWSPSTPERKNLLALAKVILKEPTR